MNRPVHINQRLLIRVADMHSCGARSESSEPCGNKTCATVLKYLELVTEPNYGCPSEMQDGSDPMTN